MLSHTKALMDAFSAYLRRVTGSEDDVLTVLDGDEVVGAPGTGLVAVTIGEAISDAELTLARSRGRSMRFTTAGPGRDSSDRTRLAIFDSWDPRAVPAVPAAFTVLAIVAVFNEADMIGALVRHLRGQGARVHVIDNWSNDGSRALLEAMARAGHVTFESFPADGPSDYFEWQRLLERVEDLAHRSGADWVISNDADEIRESPWPSVTLREALFAVEHWGYNCVDHTVANFRPVDDSWRAGADPTTAFEWYEFPDDASYLQKLNAWKPQPQPVRLAESGGHAAAFESRRVFPYKFIIRHYPIRSQAHGERKILRERRPRWSPSERARGWHAHYDRYSDASTFTWDRGDLARWSEVDRDFLVQRLSGVGLACNPWPGEGSLAPVPFPTDAYRATIETPDPRLIAPHPGRMVVSEIRSIPVAVRNDGGEIWLRSGRNDVALSSRWYVGADVAAGAPAIAEGSRSYFSSDVRPGGHVVQDVIVRAPADPGTYTLAIDLVHEQVRWFSCGSSVVVDVTRS